MDKQLQQDAQRYADSINCDKWTLNKLMAEYKRRKGGNKYAAEVREKIAATIMAKTGGKWPEGLN